MGRGIPVAGRVKQFKAWVNRFLLGVSPPRAWLEMLLLGLLLLLGVRWVASSLSVGYRQNGVFIATLSGVTLYTLRFPRVTSTAKGFARIWTDQDETLDRMLWPVVRSATDLLTSEKLDRVR